MTPKGPGLLPGPFLLLAGVPGEEGPGDGAGLGEALLSLAPESLASVLQVSGVDPHLTEYIARSLMLSGRYHGEAGRPDVAELRQAQGRAVAAAFGHELGADPVSDEALEALLTASDGEA